MNDSLARTDSPYKHNPDVEATIEVVLERIQKRIDALEAIVGGLKKNDSSKKAKLLRKSLHRVRVDFNSFNVITQNLPSHIFALGVIEVGEKRKSEQVDSLRKSFRSKVHPEVLKHIAETQHETLLRMNIPEDGIAYMEQEGQIPFLPDSRKKFDMTIDHIRRLKDGGDNSWGNHCVTAYYINWFRERFLDMQHAGKHEYQMLTLYPSQSDGEEPILLETPGGFRKSKNSKVTLQKRVNQLFECGITL